MGFETPITIEKVIIDIQANKYVLPAIQREFVWSSEQIEKLFDSLLRGYPIGSFLFWKVQPKRISDFQFYCFMGHYHERDHKRNEPINILGAHDITAVLDGQQRLTALNIGLNGWYAYKLPNYWWSNDQAFPKRELYLNLKQPIKDLEYAYEFRFLRDAEAKAGDGNKYWFKVHDILDFHNIQSVFNYCVRNGLVQDADTYASDTLMELWTSIKQRPLINFFMEEDQDLDKVLNIFIRVNSGGTPLSYSDMLLSIATAAWKDRDARQEIYGLVDQINQVGEGFNFDKDFILKSGLVLNDIQTIQFRVNSFNRENMLKIEENWEMLSDALLRTANLAANWGYNWQSLVSNYALIPIAYYLSKIGSPSNFATSSQYINDRKKMLLWLRIALLKRTFSGQPDSVLNPIRRVILNNDYGNGFPAQAIYDELKTTSRTMIFDAAELDGLLSYHYGQSYTFSVLALLYPWLKYEQQFHVDHIFPRKMFDKKELQRRGIPESEWPGWLDHINDIGNLQLLQGAVNESKSDQEFENWLQGECSTPADLNIYCELHLIPETDLSFENFPNFLKARTKLLRQRLAELLGVPITDRNGV